MTRESFVTQTRQPEIVIQDFSFPKQFRILRRSEFRKVYEEGVRVTGRYFAAFYLAGCLPDGPKIGFTVPRALGKAVVRNRIKRRVRECVRLHLDALAPECRVVLNPRRTVLTAAFADLEREVERLFFRCKAA